METIHLLLWVEMVALGQSWTEINTGTQSQLRGVVYGNGKFIVGDNEGNTFASLDGITWTKSKTKISYALNRITYGNNKFVSIAGWDYSIPECSPVSTFYTSTNGTLWTESKLEISTWVGGVAYGKNVFVAGERDIDLI